MKTEWDNITKIKAENREFKKRITELEKAMDKLINRAQQVDGWECFPESWIDEAYEALKEQG